MSKRTPGGGDEAMDLDILARDDLLLDALGRGEPAPAGDPVAALLAAWQADLGDDLHAPAQVRPAAQPTEVLPVPTAGSGSPPEPAAAGEVPAPTPLSAARSARRHRPWAVRLAAAAVALLALAAGLGVGSRTAGPGSPLWSLTRVLYPQQAEVRDVEELIIRARTALADGRLDEAGQLVDRARRELADVTGPATVARLRADLDALTRDLAAARATLPSAAPANRPTAPADRPSSSGTSAPRPGSSGSTSSPAPGSSPSGGGPLLPLPGLPLPSVSPLLPGLPLPTSGLLD